MNGKSSNWMDIELGSQKRKSFVRDARAKRKLKGMRRNSRWNGIRQKVPPSLSHFPQSSQLSFEEQRYNAMNKPNTSGRSASSCRSRNYPCIRFERDQHEYRRSSLYPRTSHFFFPANSKEQSCQGNHFTSQTAPLMENDSFTFCMSPGNPFCQQTSCLLGSSLPEKSLFKNEVKNTFQPSQACPSHLSFHQTMHEKNYSENNKNVHLSKFKAESCIPSSLSLESLEFTNASRYTRQPYHTESTNLKSARFQRLDAGGLSSSETETSVFRTNTNWKPVDLSPRSNSIRLHNSPVSFTTDLSNCVMGSPSRVNLEATTAHLNLAIANNTENSLSSPCCRQTAQRPAEELTPSNERFGGHVISTKFQCKSTAAVLFPNIQDIAPQLYVPPLPNISPLPLPTMNHSRSRNIKSPKKNDMKLYADRQRRHLHYGFAPKAKKEMAETNATARESCLDEDVLSDYFRSPKVLPVHS